MINENWTYLGFAIYMFGAGVYIRAVLRGKARPNRVTWGVISIAPLIAFFAMLSKGVTFQEGLYTLGSGLSPMLIFISTFIAKYPAWKIEKFDLYCGSIAIAGLILWKITGEGNAAVALSIIADLFATLPTVKKAFYHPESENPYEFIAATVAGVITLLVISRYDFEHLAFTVYLVMITVVIW